MHLHVLLFADDNTNSSTTEKGQYNILSSSQPGIYSPGICLGKQSKYSDTSIQHWDFNFGEVHSD